jgi:hypothetical protein
MTEPRRCYYIPHGQCNEYGYIPSLVTEGESGHQPMIGKDDLAQPWYWGKTYEQANQICAEVNAKDFGLGPDACADIVASSIAASIRTDARQQRYDERLNRLLGR